MANYYGQARSNYFAVKDSEAFLEEMEQYSAEVIVKETDGLTLYGFIDTDDNGGGCIVQVKDGEYVEVDWNEVFQRHLADGWVAIIMETGSEKYRYLVGTATAYNNKGDIEFISLDEIYSLATNIGENFTRAEY